MRNIVWRLYEPTGTHTHTDGYEAIIIDVFFEFERRVLNKFICKFEVAGWNAKAEQEAGGGEWEIKG